MGQEIERKFLVKVDFKSKATQHFHISQGFLSTVPERTVRVRLKDETGFITVKGIGNASGTTRFEWEKEISKEEAIQLLAICEPTIIEKNRYIIPTNNNLFFEVDEFLGDNKGLLIAEIELPKENTFFEKPNWLGDEVTGQSKYYNSALSKKPYSKW
ncbi:CYTH domain-containing protein [Lutibacter holmesii]|uniref:CYTH domain-containing protein n=1 Tax=Lutibacter holmesii TaxID=1137985 RepID=A0ABW3WUA3_9FLAO